MLYIDPPAWPARGRLWSHLVSDVSYAELHAFAELLGAPRRAFDRDHYDLPAERFAHAVRLGARVVTSREIVTVLHRSGLRRPKHVVRARSAGAPAGEAVLLTGQSTDTSVASSRARLARAGASQRSASTGTR